MGTTWARPAPSSTIDLGSGDMCRLARPSRPPPPVINVSLIDHGAAGPAAPRRAGAESVRPVSGVARRLGGGWRVVGTGWWWWWYRLYHLPWPRLRYWPVSSRLWEQVSVCARWSENHHAVTVNTNQYTTSNIATVRLSSKYFCSSTQYFFFNNFLRWDDRK